MLRARLRPTFGFFVLLLACGETSDRGPGGGGAAGAAGSPDRGGTTGMGGSSGASGMAGDAPCAPECNEGRACCATRCVNLQNDPFNCGLCGKRCPSGTYCGGGQCVTPPCQATCGDDATCCGSSCCATGEICCDPQGPIDIEPLCVTPNDQGTCPQGCAPLCICASPDTPIATPRGDRPIATLRPGDLVYTVDRGKIVVAPIVRTNRTPTTAHRVIRVTLATGVVLEISGAHPTADGRRWGELRSGDSLDGVDVTDTKTIPYRHDATYDILPASDSAAYYAGGVLIGSTLATAPALVMHSTAPSSTDVAVPIRLAPELRKY